MTTPTDTGSVASQGRERPDRQVVAERLLLASTRRPLDPEQVIDWDAPPVPGAFWIPEKMSSLYGTRLWAGLSQEQRIELTKHEVCSIAGIGIWFEMILMQMLLRRMYSRQVVDSHARYALKEIEEECRHSLMFSRMIQQLGGVYYGGNKAAHVIGKVFTAKASPTLIYSAILVVEEVLDAMQREVMADESVQPLVRQVCRLHVVEEARHMQFARDEIARITPTLTASQHAVNRTVLLGIAWLAVNSLVAPGVYEQVGIDPKVGFRAAARNPSWVATKRRTAAHVVKFLDEQGMITDRGRGLWHRAGLV